MPRALRVDKAGLIYHVINRANEREEIFKSRYDYDFFEKLIYKAWTKTGMRIYSYSIMPNHWHFVVSPVCDGGLCSFFRWLTLTHSQYHRNSTGTVGNGHLYQGRYKSFIVSSDSHFLRLCKYVERNPLRAGLVEKAEFWGWSSLYKRINRGRRFCKFLSEWPIQQPLDYLDWVNCDEDKKSLSRIEKSIKKGAPLGEDLWVKKTVERFGLRQTVCKIGRPRTSKIVPGTILGP